MPTMRDLYEAAATEHPEVVIVKRTRTATRRWFFPIVLESVEAIVDGTPVGYAGEASWPLDSALCHGFGPQGSRAKLLRVLLGES